MSLTADAPPSPPAALLSFHDPEPPAPDTPVARAHRGGVVTLAWELRTGPVRRSYRRDFPALSRWLGGLDRTRRFRHVPASRVHDAAAAIRSQFDTALALFDETSRAFDARVAAAGFAEVPFHDPAALTVAAPVVAPLAHRYLQLLSAADDAFASIERAWLLGLVDHRVRRQQEALLNKALHAVTAQVREQYGAMARWLLGVRQAGGAVGTTGASAMDAPTSDPTRHPPDTSRAPSCHVDFALTEPGAEPLVDTLPPWWVDAPPTLPTG